jgi:hypothetical protein
MKKRNLLGLLALTPALWLSGCGSNDDASVRLINASAGYSSLDMYSNDGKVLSSVGFATASDYTDIAEGTVTTALANAGSSTYLLSESRTLSASTSYTIIAYGWEGNLKSVISSQDEAGADDNKTKVSVFNTATDAGSLDVYLTADSDALSASTPVTSSISAGSQSSYSSVTSGTYRLRVTAADDKTDVRLDVSGVVLSSTGVDTIILTPTTGGVLVNGIQVVQGGTVTKLLNTKARVRAVAAVADKATVTLSAGGTSVISSAPSPTVGAYTLVDAGSLTIAGTVNGAALGSSTLDLAAGSDVTLLVNGEVSAPAVTTITDDNRLPTRYA